MNRLFWILRLGGTVGVLLLVLLFAYSTRRWIGWASIGSRNGVQVSAGAFGYWWRPAEWRLEDDPYAQKGGWDVVPFGDRPRPRWWFSRDSNRKFEWIEIPLWCPALLIAVPTSFLWYRDRRAVRQSVRRTVEWLRPRARKKMSVRLVLVLVVTHGILSAIAIESAIRLYDFFFPLEFAGPRRAIDVFTAWATPSLIWAAPLWGCLWAWLYVRGLNRLGARSDANRCFECGYNLTGNVSGRCPECGTAVEQPSTAP